jgi:hypothetical protein
MNSARCSEFSARYDGDLHERWCLTVQPQSSKLVVPSSSPLDCLGRVRASRPNRCFRNE